MKIAVLSDSHDHLHAVRAALRKAVEAGATAVIHCGDLVAPFVVSELKTFPGPVHVILGNNDGDVFLLTKLAADSNVTLHGAVATLELDGRKLLAVHDPPAAAAFAATGEHDAVFYGHAHRAGEERVGETLLLGAGELMGFKEPPSFALYDTETNTAKRVSVAEEWAGYV
ncbi:MAG: YfcE family phosphodiesterase [Armatimonadetes bacterium]|nr:YfcE family phosphodiesterase [Armatimonadota bacterium]